MLCICIASKACAPAALESALVVGAIRPGIVAYAMHCPIIELSLIGLTAAPLHSALTLTLVGGKTAEITIAITPQQGTLALHLVIHEVACVLVTIGP